MVDYKETLVSNLRSLGLPVYYEHFLTQNTQMPCISYYEMNNIALEEGNQLGYSRVTFSVKVWDKSIKTISEKANEVDSLMRSLGFKRTSINDLWLDGIGQRQLVYQATAIEHI